MAIRSSVTVSLVPEARGGPFVFWDDMHQAIHKACELEFDAMEVFPTSAGSVDSDRLGTLLADHGMSLAAVGTGAGWLIHRLTLVDSDPRSRARAREFIRAIIDFAGGHGAPAIIGSMQGRWGNDVDRDAALAYLCDALEDLGEHAARYHVPLLYEPLNRYETNLTNTVADGIALLSGLGTKNVRLLADLFHMNIEERDIAAAVRAGGPLIGHLHFVDSNRRAAGLGHIDYAPVVAALRDIGYDGFASAEALPYPDPDAAARQTIEAFHRLFPATE
jgi:sugar phosphate isomerase/epimerase